MKAKMVIRIRSPQQGDIGNAEAKERAVGFAKVPQAQSDRSEKLLQFDVVPFWIRGP